MATIIGAIVITIILGIGVGIKFYEDDRIVGCFASIIISIVIAGVVGFLYFTSNAFKRDWKDWESNHSDGIQRTIVITAEDGREIYRYSGTVDLEIEDRKIKFEDENGKRQIIIFGITDTITIVED